MANFPKRPVAAYAGAEGRLRGGMGGLLGWLARTIAATPERVAAVTLGVSLLLSALSVYSLVHSDVQTDLSAFEIQGRPVGTKAMAADRFEDWARNSTSAVTCFDLPPEGETFDDLTTTCADHVKQTPTECSDNSWKSSRCCASCVAANPGRFGATGWQFSEPNTPSGRRSLGDNTEIASRTVRVVVRSTDGESILSANHIKQVQATRDDIMHMETFKKVCDVDYQLDNGDHTGGDFSSDPAADAPGYQSSACDGAGGVL